MGIKAKTGTTPKAEHLRNRDTVWRLHIERKSNSEIGKATGLSLTTVGRLISEVYRETLGPIAAQECAKDLALIERLLAIAVDKYIASSDPADYGAIDRMLQRRAKMCGYDQAENHNVTITEVTQADIALTELVNEERARNSAIDKELRALTNDTGE